MDNLFLRTKMLLGQEKMDTLKQSHVAIYGIGGVGSYVAEALARSGICQLTLIDCDIIEHTNVNRQLHATTKTLGQLKTHVMKERILDINPHANVHTHDVFVTQNTNHIFDTHWNYVVDAVDSVTAKLTIVETAINNGVPVISSMGVGNRLDPTALRIMDIFDTQGCPLARAMRRELRKRNIHKLTVCASLEHPMRPLEAKNSRTPGSVAFVPSVAGLVIASEVIRCIK